MFDPSFLGDVVRGIADLCARDPEVQKLATEARLRTRDAARIGRLVVRYGVQRALAARLPVGRARSILEARATGTLTQITLLGADSAIIERIGFSR